MIFPVPKPQRPVKPPRERKRQKPVAKVNPARKQRRFEGNFGGSEYVELIQTLPCAICGVVGFTVAAHLTPRSVGGKASDIVPLCSMRLTDNRGSVDGCHPRYDNHDPEVRAFEERLRWLAKGLWLCWNAIT
jgi:hypothetical protein